MTALPVSYTGQLQSANDNLDHLAKYDYMVSQTTTTETQSDTYVRAVNGGATPVWGEWKKLTA